MRMPLEMPMLRRPHQHAVHVQQQAPFLPSHLAGLLHIQKGGGSAAAFISSNAFLMRGANGTRLRLALLKGWASSSGSELEALVGEQVALAARGVGMREMLVAVASAGRAAADRNAGKVQEGSSIGLGWWASCKQWAASMFVLS